MNPELVNTCEEEDIVIESKTDEDRKRQHGANPVKSRIVLNVLRQPVEPVGGKEERKAPIFSEPGQQQEQDVLEQKAQERGADEH